MGSTDDMRRAIPRRRANVSHASIGHFLGIIMLRAAPTLRGAPMPEGRRSSEHFLHEAPAKPGQPLVKSLIEVGQLLVIQAEQVQDRGVKIGDVAWVVDSPEAELVGRADGLAALDAGAGQPHREAVRVVVAAGFADALTR